MKLQLKLQLKQDVISGFSYSFSKALLDRLNDLFKNNKVHERRDSGAPKPASSLVDNLCHYLSDQMPHCSWSYVVSPNISTDDSVWKEKREEMEKSYKEEIEAIIKSGYDFLSTFEKK